MFRTKPTLWDGFAAATVLLLALLLLFLPMFAKKDGKVVLITTADATYEYDLDIARRVKLTSNGYHLTVVIEGGQVYVEDSDCKDKVCLHTGKISASGDGILCAPAGVRILVKGGARDVDFVAG